MKRWTWMLLVGTVALPIGCGGSSDTSPTNSTIAKGTTPSAGSPAGKPVSTSVIPPNEIVAMFADSVRKGDKETMGKLITAAAKAEIQRRGITIDPPGSPEASYKLGEVQYLDADKDAAYVESVWIEPAQNGQPPVETQVVWAVTLEEQGWRISGLAIDMGADQPATIVDFENLEEAVNEEQKSVDKIANQNPANGQPTNPATAPTQFAPPQFAPANASQAFAPANQGLGGQQPNQTTTPNGFAPIPSNPNVPQLSQPANTQNLR